jgi:hypothetical protein
VKNQLSEEAIKDFTKRMEMFQKGFEMITSSMTGSLDKISGEMVKLVENTTFIPKIMKSNKDIKKFGEKLQLMIDALMARLDQVAKANNIM